MLLGLLLLLATSTCQAFVAGVAMPGRSPCRAAVATGAASIVMKKEKDVLELEGVVLESMPNANFRVQLDDTDQVRELANAILPHACATHQRLDDGLFAAIRSVALALRHLTVWRARAPTGHPRAHLGQDSQELYQNSRGRQSHVRNLALRSGASPSPVATQHLACAHAPRLLIVLFASTLARPQTKGRITFRKR